MQLAAPPPVWVGLSIFADAANALLAWSSQASVGRASSAGVQQSCYDGGWPPREPTKRSRCLSHICRGFRGIYLLIFWAKARRSAMAVAATVLLTKFPGRRAAEEDAVGFSTHYDHRENERMELPPRPQCCAREHTQQKVAAHLVEINHIR